MHHSQKAPGSKGLVFCKTGIEKLLIHMRVPESISLNIMIRKQQLSRCGGNKGLSYTKVLCPLPFASESGLDPLG